MTYTSPAVVRRALTRHRSSTIARPEPLLDDDRAYCVGDVTAAAGVAPRQASAGNGLRIAEADVAITAIHRAGSGARTLKCRGSV